ncbi:MAG: lyase family protein [Tenuifilaceae bacterium]
MRTETDYLGSREILDDALYGIHSIRAKENFPDSTPFHVEWYKAMGLVKLACYLTYKDFSIAVKNDADISTKDFALINDEVIESLITASKDIRDGNYFIHFIVPAIQGGAGTSINMNINEIITNLALLKLGYKLGNYKEIDPIEHANIFQSTNDVVPTALKVASIQLLSVLEESINNLRFKIEDQEKKNRVNLRIGYTQMQAAVPSSWGQLFSTYSEALSRDWWRVSKCFERIKVVNLGGGAIGTGIGTPRFFIMEVVNHLQKLTNLPLTRSENLNDTTSNLDTFVEVHAILKSHAVNLEKMVSDLRLMASDIAGNQITIPKQQVGSSIMPGKINPVIAEYVVSVSHRVYSNDQLISGLCGQGTLDLNAYIPLIGHALLDSIKLLTSADNTLSNNMISGIEINSEKGKKLLFKNPSITTALLPYIGFNYAAKLASEMKSSGVDIFEANSKLKLIDESKLREIVKPDNLLKLGFSLKEI